jgi:hypothetical protein
MGSTVKRLICHFICGGAITDLHPTEARQLIRNLIEARYTLPD